MMKGGDKVSSDKTREIRISIPEELFSFIFPEETIDHMIKAKKEALLALRSLIDHKIESLEKRKEHKKTDKGGKKIKIE
jgi:hypothetical protein